MGRFHVRPGRLWRIGGMLIATLLAACASLPAHVPRSASVSLQPPASNALSQTVAAASPDPSLSGFRLMPTGPAALATRLELIRRAEVSLDVQCYLIQNDETGRYFLRLLRDAAERGVRVRLLLDDLYTAGSDELLLGLAAHPNVELRLFNPFPAGRSGLVSRFAASLFDFDRVHRRMHNKLMIADASVAIAGGRNIADDYFMRRSGHNFIDLDTLVVGAILPELSQLFDRYWNSDHALPIQSIATTALSAPQLRQAFEQATGAASTPEPDPVDTPDRFGRLPPFVAIDAGAPGFVWARAMAYADSPDKIGASAAADPLAAPKDVRGIRFNLVEHIRAARHEVLVSSPYAIPTRRSVATMQMLQARGVQMSVLTNSLAATDEPAVHTGYRRYRESMLRMGVRLYELAPMPVPGGLYKLRGGDAVGRLHAKTAVIDRETVFIGSFNFDPRSASHNTEFGLIIFSPELAGQVIQLFDFLRLNDSLELRLAAHGDHIEWYRVRHDGTESRASEPDAGVWRNLLLELLAPFVSEDLL